MASEERVTGGVVPWKVIVPLASAERVIFGCSLASRMTRVLVVTSS